MRIKSVIQFYVIAFGIAWLFWWPMALEKLDIIHFHIPLFIGQSIGAFAPLLSVLIISRMKNRKELLSSIFESIAQIKHQKRLALLAVIFAPFLAFLSNVLSYIPGVPGSFQPLNQEVVNELGFGIIGVIPLFFITAIFGSPLGEEVGWRGFALENLSKKMKQIPASLIVGFLWWVWHIPLFIVLGVGLSFSSLMEMLSCSFIIDILFLYSGSNLLIAMLCHQSISTKFMFFSSSASVNIPLLFLLGIVLYIRLRKDKSRDNQ